MICLFCFLFLLSIYQCFYKWWHILHDKGTTFCTSDKILKVKNSIAGIHFRHAVKVVPGAQDLGPRHPGTQDLGPHSKFKIGTPGPPSKFKSGTSGPPSKFKSETLIIIFLHCSTYFVLDKYIICNMEIIFHE